MYTYVHTHTRTYTYTVYKKYQNSRISRKVTNKKESLNTKLAGFTEECLMMTLTPM